VVLVEDECRIARESDVQSIWYERGKYPTIKVDRKREGISFYGATNIDTGQCHVKDIVGNQNSARTVEYLEYLEKIYAGKKVLIIWDGAPSHRGEVKRYLKRRNKKWKLELMYFPAYSPDMNPQEHVWKEAKKHTTHNSEKEFEDKVRDFRHYIMAKKFTCNMREKYA
jgi:transposase